MKADDESHSAPYEVSWPDVSFVEQFPKLWTHAPADDGGWWLLGGDLPGDPDVMVRIEHAFPADRIAQRDLTEPFSMLLGLLVAREFQGQVLTTDLSQQEVAELSSQLRWLRVLLRAGV